MKQIENGIIIALQGCMPGGTTYQKLIEMFGEPNAKADGFKTDAEWCGYIDDAPFKIYNYKTGKAYLKEQGKAVKDLIGSDWHIGGQNSDVVKLIRRLLVETL